MSSHVFKIGDRARLVNCKSHPKMSGREVIIKSGLYEYVGDMVHEVEFIGHADPNPHIPYRAVVELLEPILPDKSLPEQILAMKDLPNRDCKIARVGECV